MKLIFIIFTHLVIIPLARLFTKEVKGKENLPSKGPFIIAPNHNDGLDHCFVVSILKDKIDKVRFIAALDTLRTFFSSSLVYYLSDAIVINRKNVDRNKALQKTMDSLKKGEVIVIYPEGDSNPKKELLKGKTGVAELVLTNNVPVVPVGVIKLPNSWRRVINVGKPLYFSPPKVSNKKQGEDYYRILRETTNTIMKKISQLSNKPYPYGN